MYIGNIKCTEGYSLLKSYYKNICQRKYLKYIKKPADYVNMDLNTEFEKITGGVQDYTENMTLPGMIGKFAESSNCDSIYSYAYLVMLYGLLGKKVNDKHLKKHLLASQTKDGLFFDKNILNYQYVIGDGWGARHLTAHMIIAMQYLDAIPVYPFHFLEPFMDYDAVYKLMETLDWKRAWSTSNFIMNIGNSLQYIRDFMGETEAGEGVRAIENWLITHIRKDSGMWFNGSISSKTMKYEMVRGAYHLYPILMYDKIDIPYRKKAIDIILSLQNKYGGFDFRINSSACEDIDAADLLIWLSGEDREYRRDEIDSCLKKSFFWIAQNQMPDGGMVFRLGEGFDYGHPNMASRINESNLFATWFRYLSLCHIYDFITGERHNYGKGPGLNMLYPDFI